MKITIIDNYDSFTYNLSHLLKELGAEVTVFRNDRFRLSDLATSDKIVLSPGPGIPSEAGLLMDVIDCYAQSKPILGVCLGHQALGQYFGAQLLNIGDVVHGVATPAHITASDYLFDGLPATIEVGRYHSWVVEADSMPATIEPICMSNDQQVMALRHVNLDIRGIQFHPESVLTPCGQTILKNWLEHQ